MSLAVVVNPAKRRAVEALRALRTSARAAGLPEPAVRETAVDATGTAQARQCVADGATRVVALGGDGTVRAVAHGLADTGVELGIVPAGTANLYAHNLRLPRERAAAAWLAVTGRASPADLGLARWRDRDGVWGSDHPFLVMAGIGHDAATVAATSEDVKARVGWVAYALPAGRAALRRPVPVRVALDDGEPREVAAWSVVTANCGIVRAGVVIARDARPDDGLLDVMEVTVRRPVQWLPIAAKGILRLRGRVAGLSHEQARTATVLVAEGTLPVQLDGDVAADVTGLRTSVAPGAIRVVGRPGRT